MRSLLLALAFGLAAPLPLAAQEMVNPGIWGTGLLGNSAMDNARENTRRAAGQADERRNGARSDSLPECSVEQVPAADRRRMEAEYDQRVRADGRRSANLWAQEQGRVWTQRMRQDGVCR